MATDYDQPPVMEKRTRFFDGQFLTDQDFVDEQRYHVDRYRRHQRLLHVSGIAEGLAVRTTGPRALAVEPGTAVDTDGRTLALAAAVAVALPGDRFDGTSGALVYLTYREQATDQQKGQGSDDNTRWLEQPAVVVLLPGDAWNGTSPPVPLARLVVDGRGGVQVDATVRQYAGVRLPGPAADPATLRTLPSGSVGLGGTLTVDGHLGVGTEPDVAEGWNRVVDVLGDRHAKLAVRTGAVETRVMAHTDGYWGSAPGMVVGTGTAHPLALATSGSVRASLSPNGRFGIGTDPTQEPMHELSVIGRLHLERGVIQNGTTPVTNTSDLGLYSQYNAGWLRLVTNQGPIRFFTDGGPGTITRFTVEADGKAGIGGITAPQAWLDVNGTGDQPGPPSLLLRSGNAFNGLDGVQIAFADKGSARYRHTIRSRHNSGNASNALDFYTWSPDVVGGPDGLGAQHVLSLVSGHVGVGVKEPENADGFNRVLDVLGDAHAKLSVRTSAIDARVLAHNLGFFGSVPGMVLGTKTNHALSLATGGLTRLTVGSGGRVGIGPTDPQAWLDVAGAASGPPSLLLRSGNGASQFDYVQVGFAYSGGSQYRHHIRSRHNGADNSGNALDFFVWSPDAKTPDGSASRHALTLDGGNVGIGVVTPSNADNLDRVVDLLGPSSAGITVRSPSVEARIMAHDQGIFSSGGPAMVVGTKSNHPLGLATGGRTRVVVGTDGKTGVGVTAPQGYLDVAGVGDQYTGPSLLLRSGNSAGKIDSVQVGFAYNGGTQYRHHIRSRHNPGGIPSNALDFYLWSPDASGGADGFANRLALSLDGGNVGLGTWPANPDNLDRVLDVLGPTNASITVRSPSVDGRVISHDRGFFGSNSGMVVGTKSSHQLSLATVGTTRMTVGKDGRVGIGSTDPQAWLDVTGMGDQAGPPSLLLRSGNGSVGYTGVQIAFADKGSSNFRHTIRSRHNGGSGPGNALDFILWDSSLNAAALGTTPTMSLNSGHVGIGSGTPENAEGWSRVLDVLGGAHTKLSLRTSSIDARVLAHETGFFSSAPGMIVGTRSNHALSLATNGSTRMAVSSDGSIAIGGGDPRSDKAVTLTANDNHLLLRRPQSSSGGVVTFLEILQDDVASPTVPTTRPSILFNHSNRWWNRIECGSDGFHLRWGNGDGDYSDLKVHDLYTTGRLYFAPDSEWGDSDGSGPPSKRYWFLHRHNWNWNNYGEGGLNAKVADWIPFPSVPAAPHVPQASDARFKQDITPITGALDRVRRLTGVSFTWGETGLAYLTSDVEHVVTAGSNATEQENQQVWDEVRAQRSAGLAGATNIGLIAQEVEQAVPELVYTDAGGWKTVDYARLNAVLVEAIKEQQDTIEQLAARIDALAAGKGH